MADRTGIEWTDATWNPLRGCSRVSEGCRHCYAETVAARFSGPGLPYEGLIHPKTRGWNGKIKLVPEVLDQPLRWKRPRRIFVNSMSDLFHEGVRDNFIAAVFGIMAAAPQHTFQVLTKRPERALNWFATMAHLPRAKLHECVKGAMGYHHARRPAINDGPWPLPNVWLGVSVEDQAAADERIPLLLQCPAAVRWISAEPLLGPIDPIELFWERVPDDEMPMALEARGHGGIPLRRRLPGIDWVVAGGESGPGARPMHPDWARSLRDQCAAAGVPFLFKQWGEWGPYDRGRFNSAEFVVPGALDTPMQKFGKKAAGRHLDGVLHDGYPELQR